MDSLVFEISNSSGENINFSLVDFPEQYITVEIEGHIEAGESVQGVVRVKESARMLAFSKSITIEIENEDHTRLTIPVIQTVVSSN